MSFERVAWGDRGIDSSGVNRSKATKTWDPNEPKSQYQMPYHPEKCQCPVCRSTGSTGGLAPGLPYFPDLMVIDHGSVTVADKKEAAEHIKKLMYETTKRHEITADYHSQTITIKYGTDESRYLALHCGGLELPDVPAVDLTGAVLAPGQDVIEKLVKIEEDGRTLRVSVQRWRMKN